MNEQNYKSNAAFLCWMKPILVALKELGGTRNTSGCAFYYC